eukprot:185268_1
MESVGIISKFEFLNDFDDASFVNQTLPALFVAQSIFNVIFLLFHDAEYGKFAKKKTSCSVNVRLAWFLMELPSFVIPAVLVLLEWESVIRSTPKCILLGMFMVHYFNRSFIYPLQIVRGKPWPMYIMLAGCVVTAVNGYMQARFITKHAHFPDGWASSVQFIGGCLLWIYGFEANIRMDNILRTLRKKNKSQYLIPTGGLFEFVSCGNYLAEILEWAGFAIACSSTQGAVFLIFTCSNLVPRAVKYHRFYKTKFEDYPAKRCAVIPFIL